MTRGAAVSVAMTGASGAVYGLRLLRQLIASGRPVYLMLSDPARMVLETENDIHLPARPADIAEDLSRRFEAAPGQLRVFGKQDWYAPVASGTGAPDSMVICPCTTGTLSAVAHGASDNLMERAADVMLKERRRLVLVVRETPLSEIHLENMLRLTRMGAVILPANPGFYHRPDGIEQLVDFIVARVLDQIGVEHDLLAPWGETC